MNGGPGGPAPYPGGFPSLQVMARRLAEDSFDSLDSRECERAVGVVGWLIKWD